MIVDAEPRPKGDMVSTTLYRDSFQFYAPASFKESLEESAFIYVQSAYDEDNRTITDHLAKAGYKTPSPFEIDSFETAKALAIKGLGVAILPQRVAQDAVSLGRLKKISVKKFSTTGFGKHRICATYLASNRGDPRISAAVKEMKALLVN